MSKKILFIGAGASFGARLKHQFQPPLGKDLLAFLRNYTKGIGELRNGGNAEILQSQPILIEALETLDAHPTESNFEKLLPQLKREERESIHRSVQILFSDLSGEGSNIDLGFRTQKDLYDALIVKCNFKEEPWVIISLNYDVLFEEALHRAGIEFHYPHIHFGIDPETRKGLAIYKPHGSINFFAQSDHQVGYGAPPKEPGRPITFTKNSKGELCPQFPIVYAGLEGAKNVLYRAFGNLTYPILANYTFGKEVDFNELALEQIRSEALSICLPENELLVIGVNPFLQVGDDPFCEKLFQREFKSVTYVDVSAESAEAFQKHFPEAKILLTGLSGYVNS